MGGWNRGTTETRFGQACCLLTTPSLTSPGSYTDTYTTTEEEFFQTSLAFKVMCSREIGSASKLTFVLSFAPHSARFRRERRAVAVCHGWLNLDCSASRDGKQIQPRVDTPAPILAGCRPHNRCTSDGTWLGVCQCRPDPRSHDSGRSMITTLEPSCAISPHPISEERPRFQATSVARNPVDVITPDGGPITAVHGGTSQVGLHCGVGDNSQSWFEHPHASLLEPASPQGTVRST